MLFPSLETIVNVNCVTSRFANLLAIKSATLFISSNCETDAAFVSIEVVLLDPLDPSVPVFVSDVEREKERERERKRERKRINRDSVWKKVRQICF